MRKALLFVMFAAFLALLPAAQAVASPAPLLASVTVDIGLFYDELAPYGDWIQYQDSGYAWVPHHRAGWRPYTLGHWVWTDEYGWLWVSDEDFGWAAYHYGRWVEDPDEGWIWLPDTEWGPAWVSWREGDGYIGWAPLPPRIRWEVGSGFRDRDFDDVIPARQYCFAPERAFVDHAVYRQLVPAAQVAGLVGRTRNVTDYRPAGGRIVNHSVDPDRIRQVTGHAVPRARAVDVADVRSARRADVRGGQVPVFRANVQPRPDRRPPGNRESEARAVRDQQAYEREHQQLDRQQAQERQQLERQHQQELKTASRDRAQAQAVREQQQSERERQQLEQRQARERDATERQHQQELKGAQRSHAAADEIARRQEEQHRAVAERQAAERQRMDAERAQAQSNEIARRQEEQHRAVAERQAQQRQQMDAQHEQARQQQAQQRDKDAQARAEHPKPAPQDAHENHGGARQGGDGGKEKAHKKD